MGAKILGIPNMMDPRWLTAIATSEASASMADDNMLTPEPSEFWRSASENPYDTMIRVQRAADESGVGYGNGLIRWWDALALVRANLSPSADVRIMCKTADGSGQYMDARYAAIELPPTAIEAFTNLTGVVGNIDEPISGALDGNRLTPTAPTSAWSLRLSFGTPADPPVAGARRQAFVVAVTLTNPIPAPQEAPRLTARLFESGIETRFLGTKHVTRYGVSYLTFPWDASLLAVADGSGVELVLNGSSTTSISFGTAAIQVEAVGWLVDDGQTISDNVLVDSGWITMPDGVDVDVSRNFDRFTPRYRDFAAFDLAVGALEFQELWVLVRDDGAPLDLTDLNSDLPDPNDAVLFSAPGYVEIGHIIVGQSLSLTYSPTFGPMLSAMDLSDKAYTEGGQTFGVARPALRVVELPLAAMLQAEAMMLYKRLVRHRGVLGPVLVALDPSNEVEGEETTVYCTLDEMPDVAAINAYDGNRSMRSATFRFVEKL